MRRRHLTLAAINAAGLVLTAASAASPPRYLDQGSKWGAVERASFYTLDQGSEVIPLAWARALRAPERRPVRRRPPVTTRPAVARIGAAD